MARVSVSIVNLGLRSAIQMGVSRQLLLDTLKISEEILQNSENNVPCEVHGKLLKTVIEITGNRNFPIESAKSFEPSNLNILGYLIANAPNLRAAYEHGARFNQIVGDGMEFSFTEKNDYVYTSLEAVASELEPYKELCVESCLSQVITLQRLITGKLIHPHKVLFMHSAPGSIDAYTEFFNCEVLFNQKRNCIISPVSILDEKITHSNRDLYFIFQQYAEEIFNNINKENSTVRKVSKVMFTLVQKNNATLENVAKNMAIGERTLQRLLKKEGSTFNEVLQNVRKEMAKRSLQNTSMPISEISYMLGFSEPSIFHRSFKKWTGLTPKSFRQEVLVA